jgi:hypothetical protein
MISEGVLKSNLQILCWKNLTAFHLNKLITAVRSNFGTIKLWRNITVF